MSRRSLQLAGIVGGALLVAGAFWGTQTVLTDGVATVHAQAHAPAAAPKKPVPPIGGVSKPYAVSISSVVAKPGVAGVATVTIKSSGGYHLNKDYPTSLKLTPPAGVTTPKLTLNKGEAQLGETEGSFQVSLTAQAAGKSTVPGVLRFAVCTETTCEPQTEQIAIAMDVK